MRNENSRMGGGVTVSKINISVTEWYKIFPMKQRLNELRKSSKLGSDGSLKIYNNRTGY